MKIILLLLFISFIFPINSDCPISCPNCNLALSDGSNIYCNECADGYYFLDGTNNCLELSNDYYIDSSYILHKCDDSCDGCTGPRQGEITNCKKCANGYYPLLENPITCKNPNIANDKAFLEDYYFDSENEVFKKCYITCLTCSTGEDGDNHNCDQCQLNYYSYGTNCYLTCPPNLYTYDDDKTCVEDCSYKSAYLDFYSRKCLKDCPQGTEKNPSLWICSIQTTELYETYDCNDIINNYILDNLKYYISGKSFIPGRNCFIQVYNALQQNQIHSTAQGKYLSKLFLNTEYYKSDIIVIKIDYNKTYVKKPEVNDVKFFLYRKINDDDYEEITGLDFLTKKNSDDLIYIEKPFIYLENIQVYKDKYEVFDIFNARNEIYNNFCKDFITEYDTDLTYDYRRDNYFVNISQFCLNDSTIYYSGFNAKTTSIQCKANYIDNKFYGEEKVGSSRFKIFECRKYLAEDLGINLGFWMIFLIILFNIGVGYFFWRAPFIKILNFLRVFEREYNKPTGLKLKWTVLNPPKKRMKIIYEPKEFILDKELNELEFGRYLNQYHKQKEEKLKKMTQNQKPQETEKRNLKLNLNLNRNNENEFTSSSMNYTISPRSPRTPRSPGHNLSYTKSIESSSTIKKKRKLEEEKKEELKREKTKKKKEYLNFMEDQHQKEKADFAKNVYNKSKNLPKEDIDNIRHDYTKKQNKIKEERIIKTNLLHLDKAGNVVRDPEVNFNPFNMKYEPKEFLDKYMYHNYTHLIPVPKSERVSSGSLSSDIRNELLKLQQLREKKMVETIFLKKILYNQKLIKGYNEDFYPFTFDESIIRRKEKVTYLIIFWNYLKEINLIANVIFDENFFENWWLKIILLGFEFYCFMFFNLIFYSDDYINDFYTHQGKYQFFYQLSKSFYATLCTAVVIKLCLLLISCKDQFRKIIINRKYESDTEYRKEYKFWFIILLIKISFFYAVLVGLIIFGWVYYMCFSVPYRHSSKYVLVGTIFSILLYEIFSIAIVALISRLKYVSIKEQHRKLYNILMIVNKFL